MFKNFILLGILLACIAQSSGSTQNADATPCSHASLMLIFLFMFIGFLGMHIGIIYLVTQKFTGEQDKKKRGKK
jgi:hypothetical protein